MRSCRHNGDGFGNAPPLACVEPDPQSWRSGPVLDFLGLGAEVDRERPGGKPPILDLGRQVPSPWVVDGAELR